MTITRTTSIRKTRANRTAKSLKARKEFREYRLNRDYGVPLPAKKTKSCTRCHKPKSYNWLAESKENERKLYDLEMDIKRLEHNIAKEKEMLAAYKAEYKKMKDIVKRDESILERWHARNPASFSYREGRKY